MLPGHRTENATHWSGRLACGMAALLLVLAGIANAPAIAQTEPKRRLPNKVAVFSALDKVTARISRLEVPINETVQFGSLKVTPRTCLSSPPTERPKTSSFVEVTELQLDGGETKLFSGWMFAESPALNAVEHPVFDVWLTGCEGAPPQTAAAAPQQADRDRQAAPPRRLRRRRVRR